MKIIFFDDSIEQFIASLEKATIAKVLHTIDLLAEFGHVLGLPHAKKIERDLLELRIRGIQEIRFLFTLKKGVGIILSGFVKKSPKIPIRELNLARKRLKSIDAL